MDFFNKETTRPSFPGLDRVGRRSSHDILITNSIGNCFYLFGDQYRNKDATRVKAEATRVLRLLLLGAFGRCILRFPHGRRHNFRLDFTAQERTQRAERGATGLGVKNEEGLKEVWEGP